MTIKTTFIAAGTALAIAAAAFQPAQAAPAFAGLAKQSITTSAAGVEVVKGKHHGHAGAAAAAAIIGLGAFAIGAAVANDRYNRGPQRRCYVERVRVWDSYYQAYVVEKRRFCD
ncbi:hypothetical protein [Acuticoccus mangrovi]|uniref:Uncharacterized protein n=1 Tax=Acuticoccus mangrovi TaxID=2796142 RepID=A0A934IT73_9HYPH|nr:hypothetical protein [Acuticoccus mangrovi]MBJ3778356.1 hypothetical protein [Acuticoccus mangrovi]